MTMMTSGVIQRQLWRPFHKISSKIVLKGGLALASVHSFPRGVLWRRPWWYSAMRYVALLPIWVGELYCQTTYYGAVICYGLPELCQKHITYLMWCHFPTGDAVPWCHHDTYCLLRAFNTEVLAHFSHSSYDYLSYTQVTKPIWGCQLNHKCHEKGR